jgi:ABC-2 type transport system permease protein
MFRLTDPFRGLAAVFYKEVLHMRRDTMAMVFALFVPIVEMIILGYAIDTNVRQIKTVVYDQSGLMTVESVPGSSESRALLDRFRASDTFKIYKFVNSDAELTHELVAGRAQVGIKIPYDFSRNLLEKNSAQVLVMVDGSESSIAGQALNVAGAIGLEESLRRTLPATITEPAIDVRPKIMFNPDSRSANFFLPGLIAVLMLFITTMLTAFSVVREKERGTLEQLLVTPIRPLGLMLGKILPYFVLALTELVILLTFMRVVFKVPINGNIALLFVLSMFYLFVNLALGMLISVKANSQAEAMQSSMSIMLPTIFLSGYVFPRHNMPLIFLAMSYLVPATYMIDTFRGIILRGATFLDLWMNAAVLAFMGIAVLLLAAKRFGKMIV